MFPFLGLLSNPITKLVADKVIGAASHAIEKKKIVRIAELNAVKELDIVKLESAKLVSKAEAQVKKQQVKASENSFKDEILVIFWCAVIGATFFPQTQPHMMQGWEILKQAPSEVWWIVMTITAGSFGMNTISKLKK